jgi:hypothetical protein
MCVDLTCLDLSQVVIPTGPAGVGIASIAWTSNSGAQPQGTQGTTDTYTITYTNATTATFVVTNGADGTDGDFGGFTGEWIFDSALSANPPLTELRFDNATLASVTEIYVNDTNADSTDYNNFLETFKNTSGAIDYYGLVKVWKKGDSNTFLFAEVTNVNDNGADHTIAVTPIQSNGTFVDTDNVLMSFTPNGTGAAANPEILDYNATAVGTTGVLFSTLMSYNVPANTLANDGDTLEFTAIYYRDHINKFPCRAKILVDGNIVTNGPDFVLSAGYKALKVDVIITRLNATTAYLDMRSWYIRNADSADSTSGPHHYTSSFPYTASGAALIELQGSSNAVNTITADFLLTRKNDK